MKTFLLLIIASLIAEIAVGQQSTPPRELQHCYLDASNVSNYDELKSHWESGWGSYDREQFHRLGLKIRVGTTDRAGGNVTVDWYWIGRKLVGSDLVVYGRGSKQLVVPAAYFNECFAVSPELNQRDRNYVLINERYVTGARHEGWIVTVRGRDDRIMADKASSEPLRQLFHRVTEFEKILPPDKPATRTQK